jgi:hypothetical protein
MNWDWNQALFWGGVGGVIGAGVASIGYGGWWLWTQAGLWGATTATTTTGGGAAAVQQIATRGGAAPVRIGQAGVQHVANLLQEAGEPIVRQPAFYQTSSARAFIDIETQNFLIEVKNLANPSMSPTFREQARTYWQISQQIDKPLRYYFTNQPPNEAMMRLLEALKVQWFWAPIP